MDTDVPVKYKAIRSGENHSIRTEDVEVPKESSLLESKRTKLVVFPAMIATTVASFILFHSARKGWFVNDAYYDRIIKHRAIVQIFVQLVAGLCGVVQVSTVRTLLNHATRLQWTQSATHLDRLNLYSSLSTSHINWSLPPFSLAALLSTTVVALAPTALWVGALTPILDVFPLKSGITVATPVYTDGSEHLWRNTSWYSNRANINKTQNEWGIFSYGPIRDRFSYFIESGATASSMNDGPHLVRKSDNTNYTYSGRSHGVGASVGLDPNLQKQYPRMVRYSFEETGYDITWKCAYNRSTQGLVQVRQEFNYYIATTPQNGDEELYLDTSNDAPQIVASSTWNKSGERWAQGQCLNHTASWAYITIVATKAYEMLNATQCDALVTPIRYSVEVDIMTRTIVVAKTMQEAKDLDCKHTQKTRAADVLTALGMVGKTSYMSAIGDMLQSNIFNVGQQPRSQNNTKEEVTLRGISEALEALSDQYLFSNAGAQIIIGNDTGRASIIASTQAFRIGQPAFIYAIFAFSISVLLLTIFEAVRTRFWRGLPKLNFTDMKSMLVAGAFNGKTICSRTNEGYAKIEGQWAGEADSRITGAIQAQLVLRDGKVQLEVR